MKNRILGGYLYEFGFLVVRLKEAKEISEYTVIDLVSGHWNQYPENRAVSVITRSLEEKNVAIGSFAVLTGVEKKEIYNPKWTKESFVKERMFIPEYYLVDNINYKPIDDVFFEEDSKHFVNTYKKSAFLRNFKKNTVNNGFSNIKEILMNLVSGDEEGFEWICIWLADIFQNPLLKIPTAIIFHGEQGTGKGLFTDYVLQKLFEKNYISIGLAQLTSEHNEWAMGKQIIVGNEVMHQESNFKQSVPDRIKNLVSDPIIPIRKMHQDAINMKSYSRFIFTSNHMIPIKLEPTDRRFTVFKNKKITNGSQIYKELIVNKKLDEELTNFVSYLQSLNVDRDIISKPYENEARRDLIKFSQNSIEEFVSYAEEVGGFEKLNDLYCAKSSPTGTLVDDSLKEYFVNMETYETKDGLFVDGGKLYKLYQQFCNDFGYTSKFTRISFTRNLKFLGFDSKKIKNNATNNKTVNAIQIEVK